MATLRVENKYGLVGVDGEDGQRAIAAEDRSVWGFAKGSLVQPGPDAIRAKTGTWLRHVDPDGILYGVLVALSASPPATPSPNPPEPPKDTMTDKFTTLREKLLTHALAAFPADSSVDLHRYKVEEALTIYRTLAAVPSRPSAPGEVKAKLATVVAAATSEVQAVDLGEEAKTDVCGHEARPGDSCLHRYTDEHMVPFVAGQAHHLRCIQPKGHPTDVHSTRFAFWTSSGEPPKTVVLTHTRTLVDVAEVGPGKATEWEVPEDGWYIVLHDRSPRADVVVPQGAILRANGVVATVGERTVVPWVAKSYRCHGTPVRVTLAGEIPTDGAEMFLDKPIQGIKSAHLHRVKDGTETWLRAKAKVPLNGGPVAAAAESQRGATEAQVAVESVPSPMEGWYVLPDKVSNGGASIPKGTRLVSKGDVLATVKEDGFYHEGDLVSVRVRPGPPPKDEEVVRFEDPLPGVSSSAVLRWMTAPRAEGVSLDALSAIAASPKVERAGWYLVPSAPTRDLPHGTPLVVTGRNPVLRLTAARNTPANAPIPIAGTVNVSFYDFGAWPPSGTDVWLTIDDRWPSVRASLRYLTATPDASPPCQNVAERVTHEATPKPKVSAAGWYVVPHPRSIYAVHEGAKLTFEDFPTLTVKQTADAGQPIRVAGLLDIGEVYPAGTDMTCDGAFTWLGRVTLRYLTP